MDKQDRCLYEFGPFRLDLTERLLLREDEPVPLTPVVFETLVVLVQRRGHLVERDELLKTLWPDSFVEEGNLTNNISTLRKTLGESKGNPQYIETVPKRGYRFIADVREVGGEGSELVVEKYIKSRIVVEQEEDTGAETEVAPAFTSKAIAAKPVSGHRASFKQSLVVAACFVLLGVAGLTAYFWPAVPSRAGLPGSAVKSIAVLPFKPLVAESRDESFELGMADTLITKLGGIRGVIVRPTSTVRRYTGLEEDAVAAGRELQVDAVLDGSLQWSGERVRVRVRLLSVRDGATLWAYQCDEYCTDIFAMQDGISEKVAGALAVELTSEERESLAKRYTSNPAAYQAYVKGRLLWDNRTHDGLKKALEYFNQAIASDPNYALAYAGLADTYNFLGSFGFLPPKESSPKAIELARKALELDEGLAEAHTALASLLADYDRNWPEAEKHFKRAFALNSSYVTAHEWYAWYLSCLGRHDEAIAEGERAQTLDPLSPGTNASLGTRYYLAGQYNRALEQYRKTLALDPNFSLAHFCIGLVYGRQGRYEEALAEMRQARALGMKGAQGLIGYIYAVSGRRHEAQQVLDELNELSKREHVSAFNRAHVYVGLGDKERAFEWLEKAYADREWYLWLLKEEKMFDPLRSDSRFQELLRRVGLVP
jgi:DNA-binding winged helix-turn-helix (wHTH) protein/TolB-like protein/Tfp pilus assembly protein PilF